MQECACVSSRVSMCGERCVRHVHRSSLCPWFRITVSGNSRLECVSQATGGSLDRCMGVLCVRVCRYTGVCTQLHRHVTGVQAEEGLKSSLLKTPLCRRPGRLRMEAARSKCKARRKRALVGLAGHRCPKQHSSALANEYRGVLQKNGCSFQRHMDGRGKKGEKGLGRKKEGNQQVAESVFYQLFCISGCSRFLKAAISKNVCSISYEHIKQVTVTSSSTGSIEVGGQPESLLVILQGFAHFPFQFVDESKDAQTFHHTDILTNTSLCQLL